MSKFLALLCFISIPAVADEWTTGDTYREAAFIGLTYMDWSTTRQFAAKANYCDHSLSAPGCAMQTHIQESNPFLPAHPNASQINRICIAGIAAHAAISYFISDEFLRKSWQYGTIFIEATYVKNNYSLGFRAKF